MRSHNCLVCSAPFQTAYSTHKYCSVECRSNAQRALVLRSPRFAELSTGTVGAISELRAAIHLMEQGYNVFRALSPSCPFDLYAFRDDESLRIEVTTGQQYTRVTRSGTSNFFPTQKVERLLAKEFDALLILFPDRIETLTDEQSVFDYRKRSGVSEKPSRAGRREKFKS